MAWADELADASDELFRGGAVRAVIDKTKGKRKHVFPLMLANGV